MIVQYAQGVSISSALQMDRGPEIAVGVCREREHMRACEQMLTSNELSKGTQVFTVLVCNLSMLEYFFLKKR